MDIESELAAAQPGGPTILTIGVFDGVHLGHRHLLDRLIKEARKKDCQPGVVTFRTHPERVINKRGAIPWLCSLSERVRLLREAGIAVVAPISFTPEVAELSPREFVSLLQKHLKMSGMVLGPDFALGKNRQGDNAFLQKLGMEMGFTVDVVTPAVQSGQVISSSLIRQSLAEGNIIKVKEMLGRYFSLEGTVTTGDRRGRTLGFPTANLKALPGQAIPKDGIYATIAVRGSERMPAVTNIGLRPTFDGSLRLIETFILDFKGDLYGKKLKLELVERLRDEMKFNSAAELAEQMHRDVDNARNILRKVLP